MSILHRGYKKLYPILKEFETFLVKELSLEERMKEFTKSKSLVNHKERLEDKKDEQEELIWKRIEEVTKHEKMNLENLLGFINQK